MILRWAVACLVMLALLLPAAAATAQDDPLRDYTDDEVLEELQRRDFLSRIRRRPHGPLAPRPFLGLDQRMDRFSTWDVVRSWNLRHRGTQAVSLAALPDAPPDVWDCARSVCAVVDAEFLEDLGTAWRVPVSSITLAGVAGETDPTDVLYLRGTGFLVGGSVVATSAHLSSCEPTQLAFLFGLTDYAAEDGWLTLERQQVYRGACVRAIAHGGDAGSIDGGADWALYGVDRIVEPDSLGERPRLRISTAATEEDEVCVLGHPFGLPLRYVTGRVTGLATFGLQTDLCTYPVNSGSPVLRLAADGEYEVVGVHQGQDHCVGVTDEEDRYVGCAHAVCDACCDSRESSVAGINDVLGFLEVIVEATSNVLIRFDRGGPVYELEPSGSPVVIPMPASVRRVQVLTRDRPGGVSRWRTFQVERGGAVRILDRKVDFLAGRSPGFITLERLSFR